LTQKVFLHHCIICSLCQINTATKNYGTIFNWKVSHLCPWNPRFRGVPKKHGQLDPSKPLVGSWKQSDQKNQKETTRKNLLSIDVTVIPQEISSNSGPKEQEYDFFIYLVPGRAKPQKYAVKSKYG